MKAECIDAVQQAIGRSLTNPERAGIEQRIAGHMRNLARKDPAGWKAKSRDQRLTDAAAEAAAEITGEAAKRKQRVALQILATARLERALADAKATGKRQANALYDRIERIDLDRKGIEHQYFGDLVDTLNGIHSRLLGLVEDPRTARAVALEIFGRDSGSTVAKKAAAAWLDTVEQMRQRFNRAGGDVGRLDYGYIPQPHDAASVLKAGRDKWVAETLPLLDRARYIDDDGNLLDDAAMRRFLGEAWTTIATEGANKITPGQGRPGSSMLAKRGSEHRQIHFVGPDEYLAYMDVYGKRGVLASMQSHIGGMARNIAAVENFGPNPQAAFKVAHDTIKAQGLSDRAYGTVKVESAFSTAMGMYDHPGSATMANVFQGARNLQVASKLGSAVLSSITDIGTLAITARYHRIPTLTLMRDVIRSFGSEGADFANRAGLIADSIISDMNRWAEGNIGPGWTSKLSQATMRLSLMNAWTDSLRRGYGLSMMGAMAKITRQSWSSLDDVTRARMKRADIDEATWAVFQQATPDDWRGTPMLTKQSIERMNIDQRTKDRAVTRLLAFLTDESEYAVVNPDLMTRTIQQGGMSKGTAGGELWRSAMLFKSFPIAMISRHWARAFGGELGTGGRMGYAAALLVGMLPLGYAAMAAKDLSKGKDPRPTDDPRTWGAAFLQAGGAGILGDFFFQDTTRFGNSMLATLAGPLASTAEDAFQLTIGNAHQAARGSDPKAAAEALRFLKSNTPGASLWYSRAIMDRLFLHNLQEQASPGYLRRMERRAKQDGSSYWWRPGEATPRRAPNMAAIVGQ